MIYERVEDITWLGLLDEIELLQKVYNVPYEVINFQETPGRYIAFLKLDNGG